MKKPDQLNVRPAGDLDYDAILAINLESRPGVAALDRRELELLGLAGAEILVAEFGHVGAGYLIAFKRDAPYDGEEFRYFERTLPDDFVYVDQVAVADRFRRNGVASALYRALFQSSRSSADLVHCCEVNLVPPNPVSMTFHLRLGFHSIGEIQTHDGRTVVLLVCRYQNESRECEKETDGAER